MWARIWRAALHIALRMLIRDGTLTLRLPGGTERVYGTPGRSPKAKAEIVDRRALRRLATAPEMALGESFTRGALRVPDDDPLPLLRLLVSNRARSGLPWMMRTEQAMGHAVRSWLQRNPMGLARTKVAHHYDLSGDLYALFLDDERHYSCAYFRKPDDGLAAAQAAKCAHIAAKLRLSPGQRVLDIGCGWGGLARHLARTHDVHVTGVTLSREQAAWGQVRTEDQGLAHRVDIRVQDYRKVEGQFDRIVSVGMFEHVGTPHYREYFDAITARLAPSGIALVHTIGRRTPPGYTSPWIDKYIFPGGYVPALSEIMPHVERTGLWLADLEVWRLHYAETLRRWRARFTAKRAEAEALFDAAFYRMWVYYLAASEVSFRHNNQAVFQLQLSKAQGAVPLTRDYLYRDGAQSGRGNPKDKVEAKSKPKDTPSKKGRAQVS